MLSVGGRYSHFLCRCGPAGGLAPFRIVLLGGSKRRPTPSPLVCLCICVDSADVVLLLVVGAACAEHIVMIGAATIRVDIVGALPPRPGRLSVTTLHLRCRRCFRFCRCADGICALNRMRSGSDRWFTCHRHRCVACVVVEGCGVDVAFVLDHCAGVTVTGEDGWGRFSSTLD